MLQNPQLHYLDNAATTIVAPEVADVIDKAMREHWANPSSLYGPGARSEEALNAARTFIARTLNVAAWQPNQHFHLGNLPAVCHFVAHSLPSFLPANLFNA